MQIKTIEKVIKKKLLAWLESIEDKPLREKVKESLLLSGGSITSLFLNEEVNDYDVYIQSQQVAKDLATYYTKGISGIEIFDGRLKQGLISGYWRGELTGGKPKEAEDEDGIFSFDTHDAKKTVALRTLQPEQIKIFFYESGGKKIEQPLPKEGEPAQEPKPYQPSYISPNAISLHDNIQIVLRFTGTPEKIHSTFDFIHATNYFTFNDGLVVNSSALVSILTKQLKYQGSKYPLTSVIRTKKFINRKWTVSAGDYLKMLFQTSELDLTNPDVLEEQLIGVDVAYFETLIKVLREHVERHPDFKMDSNWLGDLIDRIFSTDEEF